VNKLIVIVFSILALLAILFIGYRALNSGSEPMEMAEVENESVEAMKSGRYVEYSPTVLSEYGDKRRVLYFYASWCPTCRPADADLEANTDLIPEDVVVIRINYNDPQTDGDEEALAEKYGITYQHTFVQIDENQKVVTSWNGGQTAELLENIL